MNDNERRYQILKRERAIDDYARIRNRSAIVAGCCFVAGGLIPLASGVDIREIVRVQYEMFSSFGSAKEYFQLLGPSSTFLVSCGAVSMFRSIMSRHRERRARNDLEDFNNSLVDDNNENNVNNNNVYRRQ